MSSLFINLLIMLLCVPRFSEARQFENDKDFLEWREKAISSSTTSSHDEYCDGPKEKNIINLNNKFSPTGLMTKYSLEFTNEYLVKLGVNPVFFISKDPWCYDKNVCLSLSSDFTTDVKNEYFLKNMESKVISCLNQKNILVKESNIKLKIYLDEEAPPVPIQVIPEDGFANTSLTYYRNISCYTIIHEVFHLFGLVDEYYDNRFPNRILSDGVNLMNEQHVFFNSDSRLNKDQANLILFPKCSFKNNRYYKKASFAYKKSFFDRVSDFFKKIKKR